VGRIIAVVRASFLFTCYKATTSKNQI